VWNGHTSSVCVTTSSRQLLFFSGKALVDRQVKRQHIHARLAQLPEAVTESAGSGPETSGLLSRIRYARFHALLSF
jgi:hypothetical protein